MYTTTCVRIVLLGTIDFPTSITQWNRLPFSLENIISSYTALSNLTTVHLDAKKLQSSLPSADWALSCSFCIFSSRACGITCLINHSIGLCTKETLPQQVHILFEYTKGTHIEALRILNQMHNLQPEVLLWRMGAHSKCYEATKPLKRVSKQGLALLHNRSSRYIATLYTLHAYLLAYVKYSCSEMQKKKEW